MIVTSLILLSAVCAQAQPEVTFTSPEFGQSFPFGTTIQGSVSITGGGSIDLVELVINHGEPDILAGPDYSFSFSGLIPGYYLIEATAFAPGTSVIAELPIVVKPEPWPPLPPAPAINGKLKVFILAGQSNMQGHGQVSNPDEKPGTFDYYLGTEPENYGHLVDNNGVHLVRDDVWITTTDQQKQGWLTVGYGVSEDKIGPEYAFGLVMGDYYQDPVLLLKTAWGGKSLAVDFRPPSAGPYPVPAAAGDTGWFYREMISRVDGVLADLLAHFPDYDGKGYEIAGFGWHQGWNDRGDVPRVDAYEENLVNFINDVRTDLQTADMPFVVANSGFSGIDLWDKNTSQFYRLTTLQNAQIAVADSAKYPQFAGNVDAVDTRGFWREPAISPSSQSYHWNQNFESYYLVGESMGHAMASLIAGPTVNPVTGCMDSAYQVISPFTQQVTVTRIDARPPGHPLDSGIEPDPIIDIPFMKSVGVLGASKTKLQITGPSVIRVPDWIPDSEKTHPDAVYYMYYAAHGSDDIRLAWAESITGEWHVFNRGDASNRAWGTDGNYTGAETLGAGVLDLDIEEPGVIWFDEDFGVDDHIASPDVIVDDVNERIILYFHGPMHKIIGRKGTGNFVATSKWGLNFNLLEEGGEEGQGPRNVLVAAQYLKTFDVEGEDNGQKVARTFGFVNGSGLWGAPIRTLSGGIASHANADEEGGYFNPSWPGDPTPLEHPDIPGQKPYWWEEYESWTDANPFHGVIKAPELVPPDNDNIVREHNQGPRHWAIHHDPVNDRDKVYAFYTCRRDLPESIVLVIFDLTGLTETERLNPSLWKRTSDVEQVVLKPELVWEGVEEYAYKHSASGGGHGYQFRDPDVFQDIDGKVYLFYCGKGEGNIGVAEVTFAPEPTEKSLSITSPFRGYTCLIGWTRNIGWKTTGDITSVDIEYTVNGTDWIEIATGVENTDYYTWTIPDAPSDIARVSITETGGALVAVSDPFFIAAEETLFIIRPSEGTSVLGGSEYGLNWASVGTIELVDLEYTLNGTDWISIADSVANPGTFAWTVPDIETNDVRIRIRETNGSVKSISDPFKIVK